MVAVPSIRIGKPLTSDRLTVFPLFHETTTRVGYRLADDALADGTAVVEEISESGSVPQLAVQNSNDTLVLFLEGEELRGAKQNRILNTSVLIAAKTKTVLPVSCVEQGRWRHSSQHFSSSDSHSSTKLRSVLKESVTQSTKIGGGHRSNQGAVWNEVSRQMSSLGSSSATMAMSDTYLAHKAHTEKAVADVKYPEGASGLAVAVGGKLVAVDMFDVPETCRKVWPRIISGVSLDALEEKDAREVTEADVTAALELFQSAPWQTVPPAGVGEEQRTEAEGKWHGSVLTLRGTLVHGSLVAGA
jgi:hypothetical protein